MSTFKKLFATIASAMVVVSTLPAAVLGQASYGAELEGAYAYAYSMNVTTMGSIDAARMYDGLTRAELGKMMSEWAQAMDEDLEADASLDCSFSDLAPIAGSDLEAYAVLACQLGLMGVGTNGIFNPNGVVDRATFGTVLSRVIRGDKYNNGNPWYANHLSALNAAGVMTNISNPLAPEIRGYAMLMMQRADQDGVVDGSAGSSCDDGLVQLSCLLDLPDCPEACRITDGDDDDDDDFDNVVKAGSLAAGLSQNSPTAKSVPSNANAVPFLTTRFTASSSSDVTVNAVTVKRIGLGQNSGINGAYLYRGSQRLTDSRSISSSTNEIRFTNLGFVVKAGSTEELTLRVDLGGNAADQFAFAVVDVESSALDMTGLPVNGATMTLANVNVGTATFKPRTLANSEVSIGQQNVEVAKFNVGVNTIEDGHLEAVTLSSSGTSRIGDISNFKLLHNGNVIATAPSLVRAGTYDSVTFVLDNPISIIKGGDVTLSVNADIADGRPGDTFGLFLPNTADALIEGGDYGFNLSVGGDYTTTTNTVTIDAGQLTFAYDGPASQNVGKGSSNVVLAVFNVNNDSGSPAEIRNLPMVLSGSTATDWLYSGSLATFTNIRLVRYTNNTIGATLSSANDPSTGTTLALGFNDSFMVPSGTSKLAVVANIPSSVAVEGTYYVSFNPSAGTFRSDTNEVISDVVPSSAIVSNNKTLVQSSLSASYGASPNSALYVRGQQDKVLGSVVLAAVEAGDIDVNTVTFQLNGVTFADAQSTIAGARLMDGETEVGTLKSFNSSNGQITFNNVSLTIPSGGSKTLSVRGNVSSNADKYTSNELSVTFVNLEGNQTAGSQSSITVSSANGTAGTFGIKDGGSVAVNTVNYPSQIVTAGADDVKVAEFSMRSDALDYSLDKVTFVVTGNLSNLKSDGFSLWIGTNEIASNATLQTIGANQGIVRFNGVDVELIQDVTKYLTLKASFNTVGTNGAVAGSENTFGIYRNADVTEDIKFIPQNAQGINNLVDTNANITFAGGAATAAYGNAHTVYKAVPAVALQADASSSVPFKMTVTNPANADGSISFSGLTLNANIGNFTGGTFTGYLRISQGGSQLYQTPAEGVVVTNGASTMGDMTFSLGANAVSITPGSNITVEFYLTDRPTNAGGSLAPYASFYVDSDGTPGATGNFVWYDGTTSFNGYKIINSRIEGTQFNY